MPDRAITAKQIAEAQAADEAVTTVINIFMSEHGADPAFIAGGIAMAFTRFVINHGMGPDQPRTVGHVRTICLKQINHCAQQLLAKPAENDA